MDRKVQSWCHQLVRAVIGEKLGKNVFPSVAELLHQKNDYSTTLDQCCGNFVTLKIDGELRGCIGSIESSIPLWQGLMDHALAAAFHDPRFMPLEASEFDFLEYEISILSEVKPLPSFDFIEVGVHGLIVEMHGRRGLLLPQVPLEWGWDRQQFLSHVCLKAGLAALAWQSSEAKFYYFSADVF